MERPSEARSTPSSTLNSQSAGIHYRVGKKIGDGSFGVVYEGTNLLNSQTVAIKFEPRKTLAPQLRDEYRAYRTLADSPGIPQVYYFGKEGLYNILVIDLLGPNLEELFDMCGRRFSVKTVAMVAKQMITLLQTIHDRNLIYRDIKPDNFVIGLPGTPTSNVVHVIDFGMAKHYRDPASKLHIPYRERKSLSGTARYMSINMHLGREQSRRDDLESLGHVFEYLLRGGLPWQGLKAATNKQKYENIGETKQSTPISELNKGFPEEFAIYLNYARKLGFEEAPDYDFMRALFAKVLKDKGEVEDGVYDWMLLHEGNGWEAGKSRVKPLPMPIHINHPPHHHRSGTPRDPERERSKRHALRAHSPSNFNPSGVPLPSPTLLRDRSKNEVLNPNEVIRNVGASGGPAMYQGHHPYASAGAVSGGGQGGFSTSGGGYRAGQDSSALPENEATVVPGVGNARAADQDDERDGLSLMRFLTCRCG